MGVIFDCYFGVCRLGVSARVNSEVMGDWHHPRIGWGEDGRAIFWPTNVYDYLFEDANFNYLFEDANFNVWFEHYRGKSSRSIARLTVHRVLQAGGLKTPTEFLELRLREAKMLVRLVANRLLALGHERAADQAITFASGFHYWHNENDGSLMRFRKSDRPKTVRKKVVFQIIPYNNDVWQLADTCLGITYHSSFRNEVLDLRNRVAILVDWASAS